jgi:multimeric flavodoxin WrbA
MKILVLNGSPHMEKGATGTILTELMKGLDQEKNEITIKNIYNLDVKPCQGCFSCWTHTPGNCIQKDDMENMLKEVAQSEMLVLATPLYVDGMTGPLKTFLDRLIPLGKGRVELRDNHMRHLPREEGKKAIFALVSPSGFAEMDNFEPLVTHVKAIAHNFDADYAGEILAPSFWFYKYDEKSYGKVLETIVSAGKELIKTGKIPPQVSETLKKHAPREKIIEAMNQHYGKYE